MIHYHGSPFGGTREDVARFVAGRHVLIPFPRREDLAAAADLSASFIFDNGAFSVWRAGGTLDVPGYIAWCREWARHPRLDWCLIPDVIGGTEAENDALLAAWPADLRHLGVPVWHLHEGVDRLARLCHEWPTVALGSSGAWRTPGTGAWWRRMEEAMAACCDEQGRPLARLHGLRMLDPAITARLPLRSADSTNAAVNSGSLARFGMYPPPLRSQRAAAIADRIEATNSPAVWVASGQQQLMLGEMAP